MARMNSYLRVVALSTVLGAGSLDAQGDSIDRSIYTTVLNWVSQRRHYRLLLVRDSTLPGHVMRFGRCRAQGADTAYHDEDQEGRSVLLDSEAIAVRVIL